MKSIRTISALLWAWHGGLVLLSYAVHPMLSHDTTLDNRRRMVVGEGAYDVVLGPHCVSEWLCVVLEDGSAIAVLLPCVFLLFRISTSMIVHGSSDHVH